jgi:hypothetical protein
MPHFLIKYKLHLIIIVIILILIMATTQASATENIKHTPKLPGGILDFNSAINKADAPHLNKNLVADLQLAADTLGYHLTVTTTKHDHTHLGDISRHSKYQAVDISIINGTTLAKNGAVFTQYGHVVAAFLQTLGYTRNKENGNPKAVLWYFNSKTAGNHFNHLHISNRT